MDEQRKRRRFLQFGEGVEVREPRAEFTNEDRLVRAEVAESVKRAVASLKPKLRVVMLLKYFEEMSYEEIARICHCPVGTVGSWIYRGVRALRRTLGPPDGEGVPLRPPRRCLSPRIQDVEDTA